MKKPDIRAFSFQSATANIMTEDEILIMSHL